MPDVEDLLSQMTMQEKVAMLAGMNDWYTVPVERLGNPVLKNERRPQWSPWSWRIHWWREGCLLSRGDFTCLDMEHRPAGTGGAGIGTGSADEERSGALGPHR